jgi:protein involved in polysaccharide export with SLBB domain
MNMKITRVLVVLLMGLEILSGLAVGQDQVVATAKESEANAVSSPGKSFPQRYARYKLQPGDVFDTSFELNPEFNQTVTVQPDGYITLRGVGDIQVKDQTVPS